MTNKLDLMLSAQKAALASLTTTNLFQRTSEQLLAFQADNGNPVDFDDWVASYTDERNRYVSAQAQPLKSAPPTNKTNS